MYCWRGGVIQIISNNSILKLINLYPISVPRLENETSYRKQTRFVEYYVSEGKTQTEAARLAGYPVPRQSAWR